MPTFIITAPDGKKYKVTGANKDGAKAALKKRLGASTEPTENSWTDTAKDVGLSAAQGVQSGIQTLIGTAGDVQNMAGGAASGLAGLVGASPETQEMVGGWAKRLAIPGVFAQAPRTEQVTTAVEGVTGPAYQPQTTAGEYAKTIGEFAPAAMTGPGGAVRKAAMTAVPGIMAETATQLTTGTEAEPYARAAAAMTGGFLTAGRSGTDQLRKTVGDTRQAYKTLEREVNKAYSDLRAAGIKYDSDGFGQVVADISKLRVNDKLAPTAAGLREEIVKAAGKPLDFEEMDDLVRMATSAMRDHNFKSTDKFLIGAMLEKINRFKNNDAALITNGSIPANQVAALTGKAKELARRRIIARDIYGMKDKAAWYPSGDESGIRNKFASYGKKLGTSLTPQEEKAFKSVVRREGPLGVAHTAGGRLGQIGLGGIGIASGDPTGMLAGIVGPMIARKFMEAYTAKGVDTAIRTVLAGVPAQKKAAALDLISRYEAAARSGVSGGAAQQEPFLIDARGTAYNASGQPAKTGRP
jgi:hypothetical protein